MIIPIEIPPIDAEKYAEVEVTINGHTKHFRYRVEVFQWRDWCRPTEERVEGLKRILAGYDPQWQLMQIGMPTETTVPLMFRRVG